MTDREKVIKALECCTKKVCIYKDTEKECPYSELCGEYEDSFEDCTTALSKDALALLKAQEQKCCECGEATSKAIQELQTKLKAQEPRIVAISELTSGEPMLVWLEDIDKEETIAGMIFDYVPGRLGFKLTDIASMDRIYPRIENYLTRWRCWTSRPTEAQREATGWNERSVQ